MIDSISFFEDFKNLKVLIIGDVMIDRYLWGAVHRMSPEAPVPVVHLQKSDNRLGGAANVALNIKAMGAQPYLCSIVGEDEDGKIFKDLLPLEDIPAIGILPSNERITTVKTRVISGAQHLLRIDQEQTHSISEKDTQRLIEQVIHLLDHQKIDVILFQDYNKGVLNKTVIKQIILEAQRRKIPTVVDPKFDHFLTYQGVDLFKPNLKEVTEALPFKISSDLNSLNKAADFIKARLGNRYTLITLSEKGIFLDQENESLIIPTQPRQITDVCGAGDTVISIAALGMGAQMDIKDISILANLAGGQVCEKVGVVAVNRKQLEEEYIRLLANETLRS